jgi:hypothetical protein
MRHHEDVPDHRGRTLLLAKTDEHYLIVNLTLVSNTLGKSRHRSSRIPRRLRTKVTHDNVHRQRPLSWRKRAVQVVSRAGKSRLYCRRHPRDPLSAIDPPSRAAIRTYFG